MHGPGMCAVTSHPSLFQNDTDDTLCYKNTLKLHHRVSRVGVVVDVEEKQVCKMLTLILFLSCFVHFSPPSLLPPCSSGYSLLHVTGEDT